MDMSDMQLAHNVADIEISFSNDKVECVTNAQIFTVDKKLFAVLKITNFTDFVLDLSKGDCEKFEEAIKYFLTKIKEAVYEELHEKFPDNINKYKRITFLNDSDVERIEFSNNN